MGLAKFMTLPCLCVSGNLFFGLRKQALPLGIVIATGIKYWRISCFQTITHKLEDAYRHVDFLSKLPKQRTVANRGDCRVFQIKKHFCSNFHQNKYFTLCAASVCPYIAYMFWTGTWIRYKQTSKQTNKNTNEKTKMYLLIWIIIENLLYIPC